MVRTSKRRVVSVSGSRRRNNGSRNGPKKIRSVDRRIPFRDLARFAAPRRTEKFLIQHTGCGRSTAKRWLSGKSRPSGDAVCVVVADILVRLSLR